MKFLVLFLATAAISSASLFGGKKIDIKEDGTILIQGEGGKQVFVKKPFGPNGQRNIEIDVTGPNTLTKKIQIDNDNQVTIERGMGYMAPATDAFVEDRYKRSFLGGLFRGLGYGDNMDTLKNQEYSGLGYHGYGKEYEQYNVEKFYNILMKIFDRTVLKNILVQEQMVNQEMYGQYAYEKMWDMIFTHEGVFDYEYLVEIISNEVLRNWFVQHGFFDKVVLDQILYTYQTKGTYDQHLFERLFNTQTLKYFFIKHGVSAYDILGQTSYNQYNAQYYYNVLMKVFDRKVLKNILDQVQIYNQEMYGQYSHEKMWDMIFTHEGIFDYEYLVQIINNEVLRNWFVQHGFFDKVVLDQILYTKGTYDQHLFERLFNTQTLKYFFIKHGVSVYDILGQTNYNQYYGLTGNTFYHKGIYGYNMLEKIISEPTLRNVMIQYGIFNKNILDQILYRYNTEGVYDQVLLRQLVNKQALYNVLMHYGVDQTVLMQLVDNVYLGLKFLFKNNFFQQTPRMTYQGMFGSYGIAPRYNFYGGNYLKNLYGQQYHGYNQGPYTYGKFFYPNTLSQRMY